MNRKASGINPLFLPACRMAFLLCLLLVPALLAPIAARADEAAATNSSPDLSSMSIEALMNVDVPVVYSASKFEQKATEAPSQVTVVTSDEIKKYGYRTLADIMRSVPGFYVSYDRNYAFLGVGGVNLGDYNSRILLLVDGHRVNNNITDGAYIDTAFILDVDLIDRVEIIRGPGSVLYGNNAFFGVINVITRQGKQLNGFEASGDYGEFDTYHARLSYGRMFTNGIEMLVSGSYYQSEGAKDLFSQAFDTPSQNNGIAQYLDYDTYSSGFGSVSYEDFSVEAAYNRREKGNPTAQFFTTFDDSSLRTVDERSYVSTKYAHSFDGGWDVTARLYYDQSDFDLGEPVAGQVFQESDAGQWWGTELQVNKRLWDKDIITLGGEFRDDFRQHEHIYDQTVGLDVSTNNRTRLSQGVYLQGDFEVVTNLHLNAGARYDQYGAYGPSFDPRVALIYHPLETSTIKAIYGTAFRAPNFLELSDSQSLKAEQITSYELDYEQEVGRHWQGSIDGFYNQMHNLITFQDDLYQNFNADAAGVDLALQGNWTNILTGRVSYTIQETRNRSGSLDLPDSPENLVKLNLDAPLWNQKIFAGLELQFTSLRHTLHNDLTVNPPATEQGADVPGYAVVNFTLFSRDIVKNLEFSGSVYNLLNTHYSDPATRGHIQDAIEQDGRTFRIKLTYRF